MTQITNNKTTKSTPEYWRARHDAIGQAIRHLKNARDLLAMVDASESASYVRRALKSTHGAERHAAGRFFRHLDRERTQKGA